MHDNFALLVFFFYIAVSPGEINSKLYLPQLFFFLFIRQCQLSAYSYVNYISYYIQSPCKKTSSLYLYFFALLYFVLMFFSHASITRCGNCKLTCVSLGLCQTFSCNSLLFFSS